MCAMERAYQAAAKGYRERLAQVNPNDERLLKTLKEADTIVVQGTYDHAQDVLAALEIPFALAHPTQVSNMDLRPEQSVLINCPGQALVDAERQLRQGTQEEVPLSEEEVESTSESSPEEE